MNPVAVSWIGNSSLVVELFDYSLFKKDMETIYIPGDSLAFKTFIHEQGDKAELVGIDGKNRWVVTREDGSKYIARPIEAKPNE